MDSKEMRLKLAEKLKTTERHRKEMCEYLNTPARLKDEDICKAVDNLNMQYRMIGRLEEKIELQEMQERKQEKEKENIK